MRWPISISLFLIMAGVGFLIYSAKWPVYTDGDAPEHLSDQLSPSGDMKPGEMDARFKEWFSHLRTYETPHKRLSDLGRGLCAAGFGMLLASGIWALYHRRAWMRTARAVFFVWFTLWAARIPLSVWYYGLRQQRFDYPSWGDSIAIGIFNDWLTWIIGAVISSLVLVALLKGYKFSAEIRLLRPESIYGWVRATLFALWMVFLAMCVIYGIPGGDEGAVLSSIGASVVLLFFLSADEVRSSGKLRETPMAPATR